MRFETSPASRTFCCAFAIIAAAVVCGAPARAAEFPPLPVEISAAHPLMLFQDLEAMRGDPERQREQVLGAWAQLPDTLQSHAMMKLQAPGAGAAMKQHYDTVLAALQEPLIPTVIRVAGNPQRARLDPALLEELLAAYTMVRGVEIAGLDFRYYDAPHYSDGQTPRVIEWLKTIIDTAARYGRFVYLPMNEVQWARLMSNTACEPLYRYLVEYRDYVVPACLTRGDHVLTNQSAVLGLWLEGAAENWGMASDIRWYSDADYVSPGTFGHAGGGERAPHQLYRAMILNGAMTGATVYSFEHGADLWYGAARHHWDESILPTLLEIVAKSAVARRDRVAFRTRVALQLALASNPEEFHLNLKDIDGVLDEGQLLRATYGLQRPGQIAELIPNRGDYFWVPFISPHASGAVVNNFDEVFRAGTRGSAPAWIEALEPYRQPIGTGEAFQARVGFGTFVMNTQENTRARQTYAIDQVPAAVRGFKADRSGGAVTVRWDYRENDLGYLVYKRVLPETRFTLVGRFPEDVHSYQDPSVGADQSVAYAVTAETMEMEPLAGELGYGDYAVYSTTESRIAEEVILKPLLASATSTPIQEAPRDLAVESPWWPSLDGVPEAHREAARTIVEQIENWEDALLARNLNAIMGVYDTGYEDPQGWGFQYVKRAFQHMLERWQSIKMHRQIRRWDFSSVESTGRINILLYSRISGFMLTDPLGLRADIPVAIPRTEEAETMVTWSNAEGVWRIVKTNPALPNFREILSYDTGPYDSFPLGPDQY